MLACFVDDNPTHAIGLSWFFEGKCTFQTNVTILCLLYRNPHFPLSWLSRQDFAYHIVLAFLESRTIHTHIARLSKILERTSRSWPVACSQLSHSSCLWVFEVGEESWGTIISSSEFEDKSSVYTYGLIRWLAIEILLLTRGMLSVDYHANTSFCSRQRIKSEIAADKLCFKSFIVCIGD
jgi:hypothetical protein